MFESMGKMGVTIQMKAFEFTVLLSGMVGFLYFAKLNLANYFSSLSTPESKLKERHHLSQCFATSP